MSISSSIRTVLVGGLTMLCPCWVYIVRLAIFPPLLLFRFPDFFVSSINVHFANAMFFWVCPLQLLRAVNLVWATQNIVKIIIFVRVYTQLFSPKPKFHFINMFMCASCGLFSFVVQLSRTLDHWGPMLLHMSFSCQAGQYRFLSAMVLSFILLWVASVELLRPS